MQTITRRSFTRIAAAAAATISSRDVMAAAAKTSAAFRFAYLTDPHIQPERGAADGMNMCIAAINALTPRPDFVLTGGDLIMDALDVGADRIRQQWRLVDECFKHLELPAHHAIGNHDVGGWSAKSIVMPGDADYGKKVFSDRYGQGRTYRSFDHSGWHFIILDSIGQDPVTRDYRGWVDDEQLAWLKADLETTGRLTPIVVLTHIPFYSIWHQHLLGPQTLPGAKGLIGNAHLFRKLFDGYQLKLVLSGHGHIVERIQLGSVTHIQGGAVSGMWWKGPVHGMPEGYSVIECRTDGTFDFDYRAYGWKARAA